MYVVDCVFFYVYVVGDDDFVVFGDGFVDYFQGFGFGVVDEIVGVDYYDVGVFVGWNDFIVFYVQLGEDVFGVDQCFGVFKIDEVDFGSGGGYG